MRANGLCVWQCVLVDATWAASGGPHSKGAPDKVQQLLLPPAEVHYMPCLPPRLCKVPVGVADSYADAVFTDQHAQYALQGCVWK